MRNGNERAGDEQDPERELEVQPILRKLLVRNHDSDGERERRNCNRALQKELASREVRGWHCLGLNRWRKMSSTSMGSTGGDCLGLAVIEDLSGAWSARAQSRSGAMLALIRPCSRNEAPGRPG